MGIQFSPEEMEVLKQCEVESLVQRSIPIGTALGVAAYLGVQRGLLKPSAKFGATPKILGAAFLGLIIGKLSYQGKCAEKLMQLPNSQVGELLRRRKQSGLLDGFSSDGGLSMSPFSQQTPQRDIYSDEGMKSQTQIPQASLDLDRPIAFNGLDDTYRPSLDTPERNFDLDSLPLESSKAGTSYEELRRKNRDDYNKRLSAPFQQPNPPYSERDAEFVRPQQRNNEQPQIGGAKNKYGDEWK
jgi:hypothetical protein